METPTAAQLNIWAAEAAGQPFGEYMQGRTAEAQRAYAARTGALPVAEAVASDPQDLMQGKPNTMQHLLDAGVELPPTGYEPPLPARSLV